MPTFTKRFIFWSLIFLFLFDTALVYTSGPEQGHNGDALTSRAMAGKILFQEHNCTSCHQLYGLGGYMGPDLTNVISTPGKGEAYAKSFIQYGTQRMPNFGLDTVEVSALVAYLKQVDATGRSPVLNFEIQNDGTLIQKKQR